MSDHAEAFRAAVLAALGAAPDHIKPGELHRFGINGKRGDSAGWCKLFDDGQGGVFGDFRTGSHEVWQAKRGHRLKSPSERIAHALRIEEARRIRDAAQAQQWAEAGERNARLWAACRPVRAGDPVGRYLEHRLKSQPVSFPTCLRLHPALPYWHEGRKLGTWPAMVAAFTNPAGELVALHRTWLTADGRKAPIPNGAPVKKLSTAAGPVLGGCIWLAEPTEAGTIGIAEGIETALAAHCASGVPTVAAYSAGALAAWQWPPGVGRIVVFADADEAGQRSAGELRQRAQAEDVTINVMTPAHADFDWCDVWVARAAVEVRA